ncbi:hypothetical protein [Yersinia aleksiciae]|uniref:Phage-like protein n=1 Tax=Yersinia aleksiciae TaxID=263819 RepID=A0ABN4HAK3_YERAE|nr:hypothetical protein [Yersinia aleksiciae]AKP34688.1 hypothetical protein ACZ76_14725 [Yersinia aleksiciae]CFQ47584.1 Uncharacterised protein [Yersinia aleksiciae]
MESEDGKIFIEKSENYTSDYSESFGYSTFGPVSNRTSSINFFKMIPEWIEGSDEEVYIRKYVFATVKMDEEMALKLADFIYEQHETAKKKEEEENADE